MTGFIPFLPLRHTRSTPAFSIQLPGSNTQARSIIFERRINEFSHFFFAIQSITESKVPVHPVYICQRWIGMKLIQLRQMKVDWRLLVRCYLSVIVVDLSLSVALFTGHCLVSCISRGIVSLATILLLLWTICFLVSVGCCHFICCCSARSMIQVKPFINSYGARFKSHKTQTQSGSSSKISRSSPPMKSQSIRRIRC